MAQSAETCKKLFVEIYSNHKVHIKVKEAVITIDAIGCQTNIIDAISQKKCDFCVALKKNQSNLYESAKLSLDAALDGKVNPPKNGLYIAPLEKAHGK